MINLKKAVSVIAVAVLAGSLATPAVNAAPKNQARAVVQADWLEKNIDDPKVRIIEVSTEAGLYERGHIKNALKLNWYTDLVDTVKRDIVPIG
jgi:thiosulfate/3-mercaptopyruvate sulfurtransferase